MSDEFFLTKFNTFYKVHSECGKNCDHMDLFLKRIFV